MTPERSTIADEVYAFLLQYWPAGLSVQEWVGLCDTAVVIAQGDCAVQPMLPSSTSSSSTAMYGISSKSIVRVSRLAGSTSLDGARHGPPPSP